MKVINCTPHTVTVNNNVIEASDYALPRVNSKAIQVDSIMLEDGGIIPIMKTEYGEVKNIPPVQEGVIYIVSRMVAAALPERKDLFFPSELVRDSEGKVIGCVGIEPLS